MIHFFRRPLCSKTLNLLQFSPLLRPSFLHLRRPLSTTTDPSKVTFLTTKCGLTQSTAESIVRTQKLKHLSPDRADEILTYFRSESFSDAHIARLVSLRPCILSTRLDLIRQKLSFFKSKGLSGEELGRLVSSASNLLGASVENRLAPNYYLLVDFLGGEANTVTAVRKMPGILVNDLKDSLFLNIQTLREHGAKGSNFEIILGLNTRSIFRRNERFKEIMRCVDEMGFDLSSGKHVIPLSIFASNSITTWEKKVATLKSAGWSQENIFTALRKNPDFIGLSAESLKHRTFFLMKTFKHSIEAIASHPILLMLSLEKRIIPRCRVFNTLVSKGGLVTMKMYEIKLFTVTEKVFLKRYVEKYRDLVPEVVDAYEGKVEFEGLELECYIKPNKEMLRKHGVPEANIRKLERNCPRAFLSSCALFDTLVAGLVQMGFDVKSSKFLDAVSVLSLMSELTSMEKFELYRSIGWSDEDITEAIKKQPNFVSVPHVIFKRIVHTLVETLGWNPSDVAACPNILLCDVEKTIIRRCSILNLLVAKGVLQNKKPGHVFFTMSDEMFLEKYIQRYQDKVPKLLDVYNVSMGSSLPDKS